MGRGHASLKNNIDKGSEWEHLQKYNVKWPLHGDAGKRSNMIKDP